MTPLDLAAIEKAAKEHEPVAFYVSAPNTIFPAPDVFQMEWLADKYLTECPPTFTKQPLVIDQSATILALCERIRELEADRVECEHAFRQITVRMRESDAQPYHEAVSTRTWVDDEARRMLTFLITETDNG